MTAVLPPALASLVEAERAFARTCVEKGIRDSFIAFFADDGINFTPHPVNTKETMSRRPPARPPITLDWAPVYGDIAQAGDLGYTTGPYVLTDQSPQKRPPQHGVYFSVWKKQADGSWKVVVDAGIQTPSAMAPLNAPFKAARQVRIKLDRKKKTVNTTAADLIDLDRGFSRAAADGFAKACLRYLADDARLHRDEKLPIVGKKAIRAFLASGPMTGTWEPNKSDISQSEDLGYTYGSYQWKSQSDGLEKGYYVRVWKRQEDGSWKVVLDTTLSLPPEQT